MCGYSADDDQEVRCLSGLLHERNQKHIALASIFVRFLDVDVLTSKMSVLVNKRTSSK